MRALEIMLEEYKHGRAEILLCLEARPKVAGWGITALSILAGTALTLMSKISGEGGSSASDTGLMKVGAFLLGVIFPTVAGFVLDTWFAEAHRLRRASWFNWKVAEEINALARSEGSVDDVLQWEKAIRGHGKYGGKMYRRTSHYFIAVILLSSVAGFAAFFGLDQLVPNSRVPAVLGTVAGGWLFIHYTATAKRMQSEYDAP